MLVIEIPKVPIPLTLTLSPTGRLFFNEVPKVFINFRKPGELALDVITIKEAEDSMAPKVRAALHFVKNGGKECIITEAGQLGNPKCGTRIVW